MPSRRNFKTITTPVDIQGEGAWVKIKDITVNEAEALQKLSAEMDKAIQPERERLYDEYAQSKNVDVKSLTDDDKSAALIGSKILEDAKKFFYDYYSKYVIEWNWVTEIINPDDNEPIPMKQPYNNPDVFGTLTAREFEYIQSLFKKNEQDEKK